MHCETVAREMDVYKRTEVYRVASLVRRREFEKIHVSQSYASRRMLTR